MAIGSLKTTTRECKVDLRVPDSLERVWYFTVERFVLASSDQGLKFIRVVNHSAMNNTKIIDAHN